MDAKRGDTRSLPSSIRCPPWSNGSACTVPVSPDSCCVPRTAPLPASRSAERALAAPSPSQAQTQGTRHKAQGTGTGTAGQARTPLRRKWGCPLVYSVHVRSTEYLSSNPLMNYLDFKLLPGAEDHAARRARGALGCPIHHGFDPSNWMGENTGSRSTYQHGNQSGARRGQLPQTSAHISRWT